MPSWDYSWELPTVGPGPSLARARCLHWPRGPGLHPPRACDQMLSKWSPLFLQLKVPNPLPQLPPCHKPDPAGQVQAAARRQQVLPWHPRHGASIHHSALCRESEISDQGMCVSVAIISPGWEAGKAGKVDAPKAPYLQPSLLLIALRPSPTSLALTIKDPRDGTPLCVVEMGPTPPATIACWLPGPWQSLASDHPPPFPHQDFREKNMDYMRPDIVALLRGSDSSYVRELIGMDPVAVFRWAVLRAAIRAMAVLREAGQLRAERAEKAAGMGPTCHRQGGILSPLQSVYFCGV